MWIARKRNQSEYFLRLVFQSDFDPEEIQRELITSRTSRPFDEDDFDKRRRTKRLLNFMKKAVDIRQEDSEIELQIRDKASTTKEDPDPDPETDA